MSTPNFVAQDSESLVPIRYYTPFDPYFYTTDNRPLQDIAANLELLGASGVDSARRATLLTQISLSRAFGELFGTSNSSGFIEGFSISYSNSTLTVGQGALYVKDVLNAEDSTPVVKQGLHLSPTSFTLTQPNTAVGNAKNYLVQGKFRSMSASTMQDTTLPYLDSGNALLPCVLLMGDFVVTIKEGTSAALGSQTIPNPDGGYMPLFVVTVITDSDPIVRVHPAAPSGKGLNSTVQLYSNNVLPESSKTSLPIPVDTLGSLNPTRPIRLKVLYSTSAADGVAVFRTTYNALSLGTDVTTVAVDTALDLVSVPNYSNSLAEYNSSLAIIQPEAFASFVGGKWKVSCDTLKIYLTRDGTDSYDNASGDITVHQVVVYQ